MQRVVITGGPSTGKTSLIQALNQKGFETFNEVARKVIKQQLDLNSNKVPWDDVTGFSKLVLIDQINDFQSATEGINFFDRGIPDLTGYMNHGSRTLFSELIKAEKEFIYDKVFLLPPWQEIYENDNERRESYEGAKLIYEALKNAYTKSGYSPIIVPQLSLEERVEFILNHINE